MQTQLVTVSCPNCTDLCEFQAPPETRRAFWNGWPDNAGVECPACAWEFTIDSDGNVVDDGDPEPEAELEIDADGDLIDATAEEEDFPAWHGLACLSRQAVSQRGWTDYSSDPGAFEDDDAEDEVLLCGPIAATCPNCGCRCRDVWLGAVRCPDCHWRFQVDHDEEYFPLREEDQRDYE